MTVSALEQILCVPFKSGVSISHNSLALPKVSPTGLWSQTSWRLIFLVQDPQTGEPRWGSDPFLLGENLHICNYPPVCGLPTQKYGSWLYHIFTSFYLCHCGSFLQIFSASVQVILINSCSVNSSNFGMSMGEVSSEPSHSTILATPLWEKKNPVILEHKKIKSVTVSIFLPSICHEMMGVSAMILVF